MLLKNKTVIVTGATRGIGKTIFYRLAEEGANVVGVYARNDQAANEIERDLNEKGIERSLYKGSVTDRSFIEGLMNSVNERYGKIDVLVNNAGVTGDSFITQMSNEQWKHVYDTNFLGTYICATTVLPYMEEQNEGNIVNLVSTTGVIGREAQSNYGASKGSIMGLTRLLSRKYARKGLKINAVAPGMINTEMIKHVPQSKIDNFLRFTNEKRLGEPEEVANAVLFLSSDLCGYLDDTVLKVDGGFLR
ncbi:SDR family NAD(P)-dependent oxidoreductase [Lentibacillus cibarius]|uniref:SDR family NAD(P)-dependent oxidoreductase n=2 Tax=Lentibacillus cibarius TaxID=2583219 RepID=A0A5S3QP58_9BACI|nr:SDR family NAD(P)-dependent oxidoreductase [Lentibacillus cibarius]